MLIVLGVLALSGSCCIWSMVKMYEAGSTTEVTQPANTPPAAADVIPDDDGDEATEPAAEPEPAVAPAPQKAPPKPARAKPIRE